MKQIYLKLLTALLAVLLPAGALVACSDEPKLKKMTDAERADFMVDVLECTTVDSFAMDMTMKLKSKANRLTVDGEATSVQIYTGLLSGSPATHDETRMTMTMEGRGIDEKIDSKTVSGFRDGMMYELIDEEDHWQALMSPITAEEYGKHRETMTNLQGADMEAQLKLAGAKIGTLREDGTCYATLTDYPEDAVDQLNRTLFGRIDYMTKGYEIVDYFIEITLDEELLPASMKVAAVFEKEGASTEKATETDAKTEVETESETEADAKIDRHMPEMSIVCTFRDFGTATLPEVDFDEYTEVEDLAALKEVRTILSDYGESEEMKFTVDNESVVKYPKSNQRSTASYKGTTSHKDDQLIFDIRVEEERSDLADPLVYTMRFSNGLYRISGVKIESQTQEMEEREAVSVLMSMLDPGELTNADIADIKKGKEGMTHVFVIDDPDYSEYEEAFAENDAENFEANAEIAIKYEDGILKKYVYTYNLTATVEGKTLTVAITATVDVDLPEAEEESETSDETGEVVTAAQV